MVQVQYNEGLKDLDPLGKQKHVCALHSCVYIYMFLWGSKSHTFLDFIV